MTNPACGDVMARDEPKCAKCSGTVSTFITQISTVTVDVLHDETKPVLGKDHRLLTCERRLHMCASLDGAQTNTSNVQRIVIDTRLLITND